MADACLPKPDDGRLPVRAITKGNLAERCKVRAIGGQARSPWKAILETDDLTSSAASVSPSKYEIRFGLIRHAQTVWNREKRIQGQLDSPLTDRGVQDARNWGKRLHRFSWDRIVCSDLGRARQTASCIAEALDLSIACDIRLREQDWGQWEGERIADLRRSDPDLLASMEKSGWAFRPPQGESREAVWKRGCLALKDAAIGSAGKNILVVTHEGVIKCLVYRMLGRAFVPGEPPLLKKANLHRITFDAQSGWRLSLNVLALDRGSDF